MKCNQSPLVFIMVDAVEYFRGNYKIQINRKMIDSHHYLNLSQMIFDGGITHNRQFKHLMIAFIHHT